MKILIAICLSSAALAATGLAQRPGTDDGRDPAKELILQLLPATDPLAFAAQAAARLPQTEGFRWSRSLSPSQGVHLFSFDYCAQAARLQETLLRLPGVRSATWNQPLQFREKKPNDPLFPNQWNLEKIGLPEVWSTTTGGKTAAGDDIVVAVLDKGFDIGQEDLNDNLWRNPAETPEDGIDNDGNGLTDDVFGWNFRADSPNFTPLSHGTGVCGIIGAEGNNNIGIAGINWNVKVMLLAVQYVDEVIAAFDYVLSMRQRYHQSNGEQGAFIVATNGSFGIDKEPCSSQPAWSAMYDPLGAAGVLSVAATANENWDVDEVGDVPTSCTSEFLIAVTNTDENDNRVTTAAFGATSIDLGAPGKPIATTALSNGFNEDFSGTSAACPHVAGSIALLYSVPCEEIADLARQQPQAAARLLRDAVLLNTDPTPGLMNITVTGGRLNVFKGMQYLHAWCIAREDERESDTFKSRYIGEKKVINIYPNPVSDLLYLDYVNDNFSGVYFRIFNMLGQLVEVPRTQSNTPFENQQIVIDVGNWANGTYFIHVPGALGDSVYKFVKI
ncbi:MAG: hypothetical protein RI973_1161 [Bacteroidota bacterium]|jgi:hypothetical protein